MYIIRIGLPQLLQQQTVRAAVAQNQEVKPSLPPSLPA